MSNQSAISNVLKPIIVSYKNVSAQIDISSCKTWSLLVDVLKANSVLKIDKVMNIDAVYFISKILRTVLPQSKDFVIF
jgi:hypothetical protein